MLFNEMWLFPGFGSIWLALDAQGFRRTYV
jgi:hypothetical protein